MALTLASRITFTSLNEISRSFAGSAVLTLSEELVVSWCDLVLKLVRLHVGFVP